MATDLTPPGDRLRGVEASIAPFTMAEKLELIARIARSIGPEPESAPAPIDSEELLQQQHENRMRLIEAMEALPGAPNPDGFSGRDHDKILYGTEWS